MCAAVTAFQWHYVHLSITNLYIPFPYSKGIYNKLYQVRLSTNLYIHYVHLSNNLYVHYVHSSTSKKNVLVYTGWNVTRIKMQGRSRCNEDQDATRIKMQRGSRSRGPNSSTCVLVIKENVVNKLDQICIFLKDKKQCHLVSKTCKTNWSPSLLQTILTVILDKFRTSGPKCSIFSFVPNII